MRPDIELTITVTDADGNTKTLGSNERSALDRPRGITFGSQQASGFYTATFNVSQPIDHERTDINLRDDIKIMAANGDTRYEGYVTEMPRSTDSEGQGTLTVQCAGYINETIRQSFTEIFVDRDLNSFTGEIPATRRTSLLASGYTPQSGTTVIPDIATGLPGVHQQFDRLANTAVPPGPTSLIESWYDAGERNTIGLFYVDMNTYDHGLTPLAGFWVAKRFLATDDGALSLEGLSSLGSSYSGYYTATGTDRRYVGMHLYYGAAITADGQWAATWRKPAVYGRHNLPLIGSSDPQGVAASDVIRYLVDRYCPKLNTAGVQDTDYPIAQLAFKDPTKVYDAILKVNSYHQWAPAVWENRTLYYEPVDLTDWDWEIRHDEVGNEIGLQGDSLQNLRNGIVVTYTDSATGTVKILHPDDHDELRDTSIDNPWNRHGDSEYGEVFQIPFPTLQADALELGRVRLIADNQPRAPGQFTVHGHIRDRSGQWQPCSMVRAGDRIRLTSSASLSDRPRLIGEVSYAHEGATASITVDATAITLDAYMDRVITALSAAGLQT